VKARMKILVIEDHAMVREGLAATLAGLEPGVEVYGAADIDQAMVHLEKSDFDLITLDLMLPGVRGNNALPSMRRRFPATPIVVLSALDDAETIHKVMAAGASGFISKAAPAVELIDAIKRVLNGEEYLAPEHRQSVDRMETTEAPARSLARRYALTEAQVRVLDVLVDGGSNRQIAEILGLSEGTVKIHVSAILKALNASNRAEAVLIANRKRR
jgi:DNA-binding NarL/FixJ family response regulator